VIFGVFLRQSGDRLDPDWFSRVAESVHPVHNQQQVYTHGQIGFFSWILHNSATAEPILPVFTQDKKVALVMTGTVYNRTEIERSLSKGSDGFGHHNTAYLFLQLYKKFGLDFVNRINGKFAFAIWEKGTNSLILCRDHLGIEPLYYYQHPKVLVFSSSIQPILKHPEVQKSLNIRAVTKFLLFNYNPGLETLFSKIYRLRPGSYLTVDAKHVGIDRYWYLSFFRQTRLPEHELSARLLSHLRKAVSLRADRRARTGVFLSGGMDSSTVAELVAQTNGDHLATFSYTCKHDSFDEAHYARLMAQHVNSTHYEIYYGNADVLSILELAKEMNEPFCDVAINVATHLLGKEAAKRGVYHIFTGDGGDELFGGHPVYEADKIAYFVDQMPMGVKLPTAKLLSLLPDTDKKKNLMVKLKRFSENLFMPKELMTHRWRTYYQLPELSRLWSDLFRQALNEFDLFEDILEYNSEADGPDFLSRSIYSDYQTAVDFYLRRNDLNRMFGIETNYPMLDVELVQFCAAIPSQLKIKGWFQTKYILKKAVESVLPHEIVHRKDKLGHSIPLKNWLRDSKKVQEFVFSYLSETTVRKRGLFNPGYISHLINQHLARRRNNSHRLWSLAVLEMWLQAHM